MGGPLKVDNPKSTTGFLRVPLFQWYMVCLTPRTGIIKHMLKEIELRKQHMIIILISIINIVRGTYVTIEQAREY